MTELVEILRMAFGEIIASTPVINSQAAAGIGTADGAKGNPPAMPGVPMSPEP